MKHERRLAMAAIACWMLTAGATQASEYIRGLGATGDPRVIARIVADLERLWPREMKRYCENYRDLLKGMLESVSHKSSLQVVEATVEPLLAKKEAVVSENSEVLVASQGNAIELLAVTAMNEGVSTADRVRTADRCLDFLEAWRKEIRPEIDTLPRGAYDVLIGGTDAAAEEERARMEERERISYWNNLMYERQSALRREIQVAELHVEALLRKAGKQSPALLEVTKGKIERARAIEVGLREQPQPK